MAPERASTVPESEYGIPEEAPSPSPPPSPSLPTPTKILTGCDPVLNARRPRDTNGRPFDQRYCLPTVTLQDSTVVWIPPYQHLKIDKHLRLALHYIITDPTGFLQTRYGFGFFDLGRPESRSEDSTPVASPVNSSPTARGGTTRASSNIAEFGLGSSVLHRDFRRTRDSPRSPPLDYYPSESVLLGEDDYDYDFQDQRVGRTGMEELREGGSNLRRDRKSDEGLGG